MRFKLNIDYPLDQAKCSQARLSARADYKYVDRVPVGFCIAPRFFAAEFGLTYKEFFKDAETQYYWLLQFAKYLLENIPQDLVCDIPNISVGPYFDNVVNASAFGAEIIWPENETLHAIPTVKSVEQMERMEIPSVDAGLWSRVAEWQQRMTELARQTRVTFNGREGNVKVVPPDIGGEGPHMVAIDLVGTDFYWWMVEYPRACHRFLDKITTGMIAAEENFRRMDSRPRGGFGLAEDSAQTMSLEMFREFCGPYDNRMYDTFDKGLRFGRGMHMCGDSTHLHGALVKDLRITTFDAFGCRVSPSVAAKNLGGKMLLWGNIDPMLMRNASKAQVKQACMEALKAMAPCGGLLLGDGANVCPDTPLENMAVFTEASEEYGLPDLAYSSQADNKTY